MTERGLGTAARVSAETLILFGARFHLVWLRDNCPCATCQVPETRQKLFDITATSMRPVVRDVRVRADGGAVHVTWDETSAHESVFSRAFLDANAYDRPFSEGDERPMPTLWDGDRWRDRPLVARALDDDAWQDDVERLGFALVGGLAPDGLAAFAGRIGPLQPTEFGTVTPLRAVPDANDIGETGIALEPHTDYTVYMEFPPVLSFLHCVQNESDGGESLLVDGFAVAEALRSGAPDAFSRLATTPLPFHQVYHAWRYHHLRERPVIELGSRGDVVGVHSGHAHTRDWRLPFDDVVPTYAAYATFLRMLNDPARQLRRRLAPGECLVFRNERILHGRTAFDAGSGPRHLEIAYVSWSHFTARRRYTRET